MSRTATPTPRVNRRKVSSNKPKKARNNEARDSKNKKMVIKNDGKSNLKIIALGGLDEIGKNITVFQYEDEIIVGNSKLLEKDSPLESSYIIFE